MLQLHASVRAAMATHAAKLCIYCKWCPCIGWHRRTAHRLIAQLSSPARESAGLRRKTFCQGGEVRR